MRLCQSIKNRIDCGLWQSDAQENAIHARVQQGLHAHIVHRQTATRFEGDAQILDQIDLKVYHLNWQPILRNFRGAKNEFKKCYI